MELSNLNLLPEQLVKAIGATLIHSLWQGIVLAVLTWLIILFTRKAKSSFRYQLLVTVLGLFFITTLVTLGIQVKHFQVNSASLTNGPTGINEIKIRSLTTTPTNISSFDQVQGYLNSHSNLFVLIWFLIVIARSLQLIIGLNGLSYLRNTANIQVSEQWQHRVEELANQLKIKQIIAIAESALVKVPLVIGHFKPLILMPIGLLTALPVAEIEAIIIHELAHVYRRDYLINILQGLIEIFFFFNPAVIWLSSLIKAERENCCDDLAISQTSSKVNYIRALLSCQEYQIAAPSYAMTFSKKGALKSRVKRLVYNHNHSLNVMEKSLIAICVVVAGLGLLAFSNTKKMDNILVNTSTVVKKLTVNGNLKVLPAQQQHTKINTSTRTESKTTTSIDHPEKQELKELGSRLNKLSIVKLDSIKKTSDNSSDTTSKNRLHGNVILISNNIPIGIKYQVDQKTAKDAMKGSLGDQIAQDLVKDGLVTSPYLTLSFKLSEKELIVNNAKIGEETYRKYRAKYVPAVGPNGWTLYHNYDTSTTVTTSSPN